MLACERLSASPHYLTHAVKSNLRYNCEWNTHAKSFARIQQSTTVLGRKQFLLQDVIQTSFQNECAVAMWLPQQSLSADMSTRSTAVTQKSSNEQRTTSKHSQSTQNSSTNKNNKHTRTHASRSQLNNQPPPPPGRAFS